MIKIELPDGSRKELDSGITGQQIAEDIGQRLAQEALAVKVDGTLKDLTAPITANAKVEIITFEQEEGKNIFWHSSAHLLAHAIKRIFPDAKLAVGPAITEGFYYDIDVDTPFTTEDLEKIEAEMKKIVEEKIDVERIECKTKDEARALQKDEPYKLQIIDESVENITVYKQGDFQDLCRGPHLPNTKKIKSFKITKVAGAYWKGDEKNKQLQRVYGISFPDKKMLKDYLFRIEEAKKRDHVKLGKELGLFVMSELVGSGLPLLAPKGMIIRNEIVRYLWDLHKSKGYEQIWTPHIAKDVLYKTSGHWDKFGDELFKVKGKSEEFVMKPMNCPHHMQIYKNFNYSYKDLPIRYFEPATVYRDEKSGELHGLSRVRALTQDDGHLFCRIDQIKQEVKTIVGIIREFYETIGMNDDYWVSLSVRGDDKSKYLGSDEVWEIAEQSLQEAADENQLNYKRIEGEAAFYGPKLDFMFKDALGREWQLATIQCDFNLPERFDLSYTSENNEKERPVVIHRAISGSLERFMSVLIEHFAGKFPLWLSPVQVKILTVADRFLQYADEVAAQMRDMGIRVEVDRRSESVSKKVRDAQMQKINYILVVGEKEVEDKTVTVRTRNNEVLGPQAVDEFIGHIIAEATDRTLPKDE
ncbi:threonine--tRNA ligase [Candidatus Woesearchaeota archaeon]|nr:threonine--tRNA ligase [Candidatus Woesearchaeota archaeon]